jgi:hypothetical protein
MQILSNKLEFLRDSLIDGGERTASSLFGQAKLARLILAILKLEIVVFPAHKGTLAPMMHSVYAHKSLCDGVKIIPPLHKIIRAKQLTIVYARFLILTNNSL